MRVLESLLEDVPSLRLVDLEGGDKHNAIPREAFATVLLPKGKRLLGSKKSSFISGVGCWETFREVSLCWDLWEELSSHVMPFDAV